jgi:hypothetical protein
MIRIPITESVAGSPLLSASDDGRGTPPPRAPAEGDWIEEARRAFARRCHDETGMFINLE